MTIVPMLRVGMQFVTLRVTNLRRAAYLGQDAERPERYSHAERWNDELRLKMTIVPMLRVGMQFVTLRVTNLRRTAYLGQDAERPDRHSHAERWNDELRLKMTIVPMLRVGMQFVTLCVTNLRRAAYLGQDAERPERHSHAERWNDELRLKMTCVSNKHGEHTGAGSYRFSRTCRSTAPEYHTQRIARIVQLHQRSVACAQRVAVLDGGEDCLVTRHGQFVQVRAFVGVFECFAQRQ
ncbi:hypothetical protein PCPL58_3615 [Pseudomonas cerasi]|uniref:Uncharacterized protein n=1 Tax=Pseudomonas cerasi TaxID=1583341 RepID=A0A193SSA2_9PSED|nr:hypothetical protein PCPL58_3615 [Pseudomonas cerasi]SOS21792.1 hypothetical protein PL963_03705 [Pseudomonas cerasi]